MHDPAGAPWEVYTVKDDNPADARPATASLEILGDGACCTPASGFDAATDGEDKAQACCASSTSSTAPEAAAPKAQACCS